jgi:hypothetical protein
MFICKISYFITIQFEYTKGEIRSCKSKKDLPYNSQKIVDKRTNNDAQHTIQKAKDRAKWPPLKGLRKVCSVHVMDVQSFFHYLKNESLLLNAKCAIIQLFHDENKLHDNTQLRQILFLRYHKYNYITKTTRKQKAHIQQIIYNSHCYT